jgi:esterase/lipase superfamily enzyme
MTTVYFATNRAADSTAPFGYGSGIVPYVIDDIVFARAEVSGIDLTKEGSGTISAITNKTGANFDTTLHQAIVASNKNLLVFIHGFDNSFEDAIKRAAFNREWFAASSNPSTDMTVIAFTWPSGGQLFAAPPHCPPDAYFADQSRAGQSAFHLAYFLRVIDQLRTDYRATKPDGRIVLLSHSMGNYALARAVELWFTSRDPNDLLFDAAILAAADEIDDTFLKPSDGHLSDLPRLAQRIAVYNSERDVAMYLSTTLNLTARLGFDGPANKHDALRYPPEKFRMVDVTNVEDYDLLNPPDASHQYYRRSSRVRGDIVQFMAGAPLPGGVSTL